jgi:hypothetical protein
MEENKAFTNLPYNERSLLIVVENENKKTDKIEELEKNNKYLEKVAKTLLEVGANNRVGGLRVNALLLGLGALGTYFSSNNKEKKTKSPIYVATPDEVAGVTFSTIVPSFNGLYIANPVATDIYYSASEFHELVKKHKFNEVLEILQSLGAREITATINEEQKRSTKGEIGSGVSVTNQTDKASKIYFKGTYKPKNKPILPDKLYWYEVDGELKNIVEGRLYRGMESFELVSEVTSDFGITSELITKLEKAIGIKLKGEYKSFKKTYLKITGKFEST